MIRESSLSRTPPGKLLRGQKVSRRCSRRHAQVFHSHDRDNAELDDTASEFDDSLEQVATDCSGSGTSSSWSHLSPGWSPASVGGACGSSQPPSNRRRSKRRSISDLSQSARMTPKAMESRGPGIPWQRTAGICTLDFKPGDAARERALQLCLLPSPEPCRAQARSPPRTPEPEFGSPSAMQRQFLDRVRRASRGDSSGDDVEENSSGLFSPPPRQIHGATPECSTARRAEDQLRTCADTACTFSAQRVKPQIQKVPKQSRRPINASLDGKAFPALAQYQQRCRESQR